ncbi:MAG: hypothetical protein JNK69_04695 [Saprospiraceae bacterium]|nr:hypothetical protein [Saprospiraceae bacterium]MCC6844261.1 hypothetical protein [Saprospiraceae bacterium]
MMDHINSLHEHLLSMKGCSAAPHFEKTAYRTKKRIFASLDADRSILCVKLSPVQQSVFLGLAGIEKIPNKWGDHGWTNIHIREAGMEITLEMCALAYANALC